MLSHVALILSRTDMTLRTASAASADIKTEDIRRILYRCLAYLVLENFPDFSETVLGL